MPDYKRHMSNKFASCRLLATARDVHRNRDVKVFMLPGDFDAVGVSDGVDVWIAPTTINPFSVDVRKLLGEIRAGGDPAAVTASPRRKLVVPQPEVTTTPRRRLHVPA